MRRRSSTLHADNVDDFLHAAQRFDACPHPFRKAPSKRRLQQDQPNDDQVLNQDGLDGAEDPFVKEKGSNSSWDNFDFDCEHVDLNNTNKALTMPSLTLSDNTVDTDCSEDAEGGLCKRAKSSVLRRIMVIGMNGSGKHSLINTMFECEENVAERKGQLMDLLTKTENDDEDRSQVRYQFWIQNLYDEGDTRKEKLKDLIKVYYRNVSLFVFMYSITSKKSLERLNSEIESVLKEVPAEKFVGVLLGNKGDMEMEREVSLLEGISLQDKYKLTFFMETNFEDKSLKDRLIQLLQEGDKAAKDLGTKKGYSILSTD